ncbi:MAG TPA: 3-hydroxyacyl-ACP dehydratase FabZ [Myxococcota bacterium]|nr:3-hydroxyacyl-ACP dehydratase FabZ [Myxococcota bacterium]
MAENIINFEGLRKIIPHRYPFLLIDRILSVTSEHIQALKNVSGNEPFFAGHFPKIAVMPGVLQLEAMAQAAGLILACGPDFNVEKEIGFLAGVDDAKFKRVVIPGDQLIVEARVIAKKKSVVKFAASATVAGEIASLSTITLVIKPI